MGSAPQPDLIPGNPKLWPKSADAKAMKLGLGPLQKRFWGWVERILPPEVLAGSPQEQRLARILGALILMPVFLPPLGFLVYFQDDVTSVIRLRGFLSAATPWIFPPTLLPLMWLTKDVRKCTHVAIGTILVACLVWQGATDGIKGPSTTYVFAPTMIAGLLLGPRASIRWGIATTIALLGMLYLSSIEGFFPSLDPTEDLVAHFAVASITIVLVIGISQSSYVATQDALNKLENARIRAENLADQRAQFLAQTSHDLRTPMNGIIGYAQLLLEEEVDDEKRDALETIRSSADTLVALVNDVLDLSKIEAGKMTLESLPIYVESVAHRCLELMAPRAHEKGVEVSLKVDPEARVEVLGDPTRLTQVIINLVGNAIKFTSEGMVRVHIYRVDDKIRIAVEDTGAGIPADVLPTLFEAYQQADSSTTRTHGGTGLGLSIVRNLVELMEGTIGAESELGKGSCFFATIPMPPTENNSADSQVIAAMPRPIRIGFQEAGKLFEKDFLSTLDQMGFELNAKHPDVYFVDDVANDELDPSIPKIQLSRIGWPDAPHNSQYTQLRLPTQGHQIQLAVERALYGQTLDTKVGTQPLPLEDRVAQVLIADDALLNRRVGRRLLERCGHQVAEVADGAAALDALCKGNYDYALLDIEMPHLSGLEVARQYRAGTPPKPTFLVAVSGHATLESRLACEQAGFDAVLPKPLEIRALRDLLNTGSRAA